MADQSPEESSGLQGANELQSIYCFMKQGISNKFAGKTMKKGMISISSREATL